MRTTSQLHNERTAIDTDQSLRNEKWGVLLAKRPVPVFLISLGANIKLSYNYNVQVFQRAVFELEDSLDPDG